MSNATLTCPYCNASLTVPAGAAAEQRIVCPRCGDAFPLRPTDTIANRAPASLENGIVPKPATSFPEAALPVRRSNRAIAALVLGVMLLMAGIGLAFMLMTQAQRRAQDTNRPPRRPGKQLGVPELSGPPSVESIPPDKLEALGYLPADVNFLAAVRLPELLAYPLGVQMLREPLRLGDADYRLHDLPGWLGLRADDLDHMVLGVRVKKDVIPPFYLVIRTLQPYEEEPLRQRLKGKRVASADKKKIFAFRLPRGNLTLHVWCAEERTLVLSLFPDQLEALPSQPVAGLRQFAPEIRALLTERREAVAPLWLAGHSSDWSATLAAPLLSRLKKEEAAKLASLRTFGLWIVPDQSLAVKGVFACKDEAGARELEEYVRSRSRPEAHLKTAQDGPWLTLQFQTEPDFLTRWMKH